MKATIVAGSLVLLLSMSCWLCTSRAAESWDAVEQTELRQSLEQAPTLQTESLGEPARGLNVWEHWLVPNPDGKTWDVLQAYFKEYGGPTWLYVVDLGTGQVKKQRLADNHQFYLSGRALGSDGKYYIATPSAYKSPKRGMDLFVYDPATNTLEERGEIVSKPRGEVRPLALGPDGRIYGTGSYMDGRVGLYIYDPKLRKVVKNFGGVGPSHPNGAWSGYTMGVDDTHAYIASGRIPVWYLVAVNLQSGEEKVLLESPTKRVMRIVESFPGARVIVPQGGNAPNKEYWLYHGKAIPKINDTPPWPKQTSPWDKAGPKPETYFDQIEPDADGNATLWYRSSEDARAERKAARGTAKKTSTKPEDLGWKSVRLESVETYPYRISHLTTLPDGRLHGTGSAYVGSFIFDPKSEQTTYLGPRLGLSVYTTIVHGEKFYFGGYSSGPVLVYDPKRPWTLGKGGPPGQPIPRMEAPASNPRRLGKLAESTRIAIAHSSAIGADGKIYFGGIGKRSYTGGGFGWYDPKTEQLGGFWKPLSGYAVYWLAAAHDRRLIVMSTTTAQDELNGSRVSDEAKLFVYDVNQTRIVREIIPVPKARTTGLVTEIAPGRLLGLTVDPEHPKGSILYGVDVATGDVLFRKALPWPAGTDSYWPRWVNHPDEYLDLVHDPDGFLWTYLKDVLVRIDPKDASVHVVGKINPPGRITFVGRDAYLAGTEQLRRIREIVPMK